MDVISDLIRASALTASSLALAALTRNLNEPIWMGAWLWEASELPDIPTKASILPACTIKIKNRTPRPRNDIPTCVKNNMRASA